MVGGAMASTEGFRETSLVLAKDSGKKESGTRPLRLARSTIFVSLDRAEFVRDRMTEPLEFA